MVGASVGLFQLEMNNPIVRSKPRASGIGDCARKQGYSMRNVGATNGQARDGALTTEQGRQMEELSVELIRAASNNTLVVANRQIELPPEYIMTGHPDGQIVPIERAYWRNDCAVCGHNPRFDEPCDPQISGHVYRAVGWTAPIDTKVDGQVVGFEHKHLGQYGYNSIWKEGFVKAEPGYYAQTLSYADALGWDTVRVVVLAQDSSGTNQEASINLGAKNPKTRWANQVDYHPKLTMLDLDMGLATNLQARLRLRAQWLTSTLFENAIDPGNIVREADPETWSRTRPVLQDDGTVELVSGPEFPCGWCPWLTRCMDDGPGHLQAPALPF